MRKGYDATRRNRNIGTASRGHGNDNKMKIPAICGHERRFFEQLGKHARVDRQLGEHTICFLVEETLEDHFHACTVDDVCFLWEHLQLSQSHSESLDTVLFRQPTRKQARLSSVWGRLVYSADFGLPNKQTREIGPAIILEATPRTSTLTWSRSLDSDAQTELQRLVSDGHKIIETKRAFRLELNSNATRNTQLYRTLPHEVGHWVDYLTKVVIPSEQSENSYDRLSELYFARPKKESEAFANNYADRVTESLRHSGSIPFPRRFDPESIKRDGLRLQDFSFDH